MVFEAHCMSFPCTELLFFNYAQANTVFHSMAPLMDFCSLIVNDLCMFDFVIFNL